MSSTLLIIVITCAVSLVALGNPKMLSSLLLWPPAVTRQHEYHRLLSYGLVHGDLTHLAFNMVTLYFFGSLVEGFYNERLGPFGFAIFYVLGLLASILPSWWRHRNDTEYRSLGASGSVMAVLFAFILFDPWATLGIFFVIPMPAIVFAVLYVGYTIWSDRRGADRINHNAHLWGAVYGVAATLLIEPRVFWHFLRQLGEPRLF